MLISYSFENGECSYSLDFFLSFFPNIWTLNTKPDSKKIVKELVSQPWGKTEIVSGWKPLNLNLS